MGLMLGAIQATLALDNGGFKRGLLEAQAVTSTFGETFTTAVVNPILGAIQALGKLRQAMVDNTTRWADYAEQVDKVSRNTGIAVETIQGLYEAMKQAGKETAVVDAGLNAFNQRLGDGVKDGGAFIKTLQQLGASVKAGDRPEQVFTAVIDALAKVKDPAVKAALAVEAFGRSAGPEFGAMLQQGSTGLAKFIEDQKKIRNIFSAEDIGKLLNADAYFDQINAIKDAASKQAALAAATGAYQELLENWQVDMYVRGIDKSTTAIKELSEGYKELKTAAEAALDAVTQFGQNGSAERALRASNKYFGGIMRYEAAFLKDFMEKDRARRGVAR